MEIGFDVLLSKKIEEQQTEAAVRFRVLPFSFSTVHVSNWFIEVLSEVIAS